MKKFTAVLAIVLMASAAWGQTQTTPQTMPGPLPKADDYTSLTVINQSQGTVEIPHRGPELLIAKDKNGNIYLTVYRDGHVVTPDKKKIDKISSFFWKTFAEHYRQETDKCSSW